MEKKRVAGLREFEHQLRHLAEKTDHLFWVVSADLATMHYVSPSYEAIWGRSVESVIANPRSFLDAIHPEDREAVAKRQQERHAARGTSIRSNEYRIVHPSGEIRWVRSTNFPLFDEHGDVTYITGLVEDITDAKLADKALEQSEERFRTIFKNVPVMIDSFDRDGRCLLWNNECERVLGWSQEEIVEHDDPLALFYPDPADRKRASENIANRDGKFREYTVRAKNGSTLVQAWADFRLPDGATISVGYDLSEQKMAERALRESAAKYRLLFENAGVPVVFMDRQGTFLLLNQQAALNLGGSPEQFVGRSVREIFPPEDANKYVSRMDRIFATGEGERHEDAVHFPNGETRWYFSTLEPVRDAKGEIVGVQVVSQETTERKLAEQAREQSEAQLRALATRLQSVREEESAKMAREIHDELGQKLTALKMDLAWVQRRVARVNSDETRGAVIEKIASMYDEIDETINSVRRISTRLRPGILDDLGLLGAVEWEAEQFEKRTGVRCAINVDESCEPVLASRCSTAMFRIFQEILTNIARHAEAQHVTVDLGAEGGLAMMSVHDDGRGIEDDIAKSAGLGILGMSERAAFCGGSVVISRANGGGTRVDVKIPVSLPDAESNS